jgi:FkbM family methyltransferase
VASYLPLPWQQDLKRRHYRRQISRGTFTTGEPEYALLPSLVKAGMCVIDVGANVGHYTLRLADLAGRVIAVEPVPETFAMLAANCAGRGNVTLLNVAASDSVGVVNIAVPRFSTGLRNWYEASITAESTGLSVLAMPLDSLDLPKVGLVKIDAEGHELQVLFGMRQTIERDRPLLIVETGDKSEAVKLLESWGYGVRRLDGSPNVIATAR